MRTFSVSLLCLSLASVACGGATLGSGVDVDHDAGIDLTKASGNDGGQSDTKETVDAALGDGGCIEPALGGACSDDGPAPCQPPGNVCCVGYEWGCSSGVWAQFGVGCACDDEDASFDLDASVSFGDSSVSSSDAETTGDAGDPCGGCGSGQVCVVSTSSGGPCEQPGDGGVCPNGQVVPPESCCDDSSTTATCEPIPAACDGTVSCGCAASLCQCMCQSASATTLECACDFP